MELLDWVGVTASVSFSIALSIWFMRNANQRFSGQLNHLKDSSNDFSMRTQGAQKTVEAIQTNFREHFDEMEQLLLSTPRLEKEELVRVIRSKPLTSMAPQAAPFRVTLPDWEAPTKEEPARNAVDWEKTRNEWKKLLESKSTGISNEQKLKELEHRMDSMLERYQSVRLREKPAPQPKLDQAQLLHTVGNLLNLFELEHKTQSFGEEPKKEVVETMEPAGMPSKEEINAIAIELQKHRIITELDKIIELVKFREKISMNELSKLLGMSKNEALERCELLDKNGLISLHYPPLGDPIAFDILFLSGNEKGRR